MTIEENILIREIKEEHHISSVREDDSNFLRYIREGISDINLNNGVETDFEKDLLSRRLLKLYVLFADNKQLADFKILYAGDYAERQRYYFQKQHSNI